MKNFIELEVDNETILVHIDKIVKVELTDEGPIVYPVAGERICPDITNLQMRRLLEEALM